MSMMAQISVVTKPSVLNIISNYNKNKELHALILFDFVFTTTLIWVKRNDVQSTRVVQLIVCSKRLDGDLDREVEGGYPKVLSYVRRRVSSYACLRFEPNSKSIIWRKSPICINKTIFIQIKQQYLNLWSKLLVYLLEYVCALAIAALNSSHPLSVIGRIFLSHLQEYITGRICIHQEHWLQKLRSRCWTSTRPSNTKWMTCSSRPRVWSSVFF